jgi:hypothetical protein
MGTFLRMFELAKRGSPSSASYFGYSNFTEMSITVKPKKGRGRPPTGRDPMIGFRAPPELRRAINDWRRNQADLPSLSEAIRRLVEEALGEAQRKKRG